jgi:hypothetical protein
MAVTYVRNTAHFADAVGVEEAEALLAWLHEHPKPKLDLAACTHIHAAELQVLMAARLPVAKWPRDAALAVWLQSALSPKSVSSQG